MKLSSIKNIIPVLLGIGIWFSPHPAVLLDATWHSFAVLAFIISGFMIFPTKLGVVSLIGLTIAMVSGTMTAKVALNGYSNGLLWMIVSAYFFAIAFLKSGLGKRIALYILSKVGKTSMGIALGMNLTGTLMSAGMPSGTARASGVIYPILKSICDLIPERSTCQFLMASYVQSETFICYLFVTAMAGNVLVMEYARTICGIDVTWLGWALYACVPGLISFFVVPWACALVCKPKKDVSLPSDIFNYDVPVSKEEKILAVTFVMAIGLWCFSDNLGIPTCAVAFLALSIMLLTGVIVWDDIISEKSAWNTFVWLGALMGLASTMSSNGFMQYVGTQVSGALVNYNWVISFIIVCWLFHYSQYLFASTTSHLMALYGVALAALMALHCPPMLSIMTLCLLANTATSVTQYSGGQCPMFADSGYFTNREFVDVGFKLSWVHFFLVMITGPSWWKVIGLW